jgi:hypothetical protein
VKNSQELKYHQHLYFIYIFRDIMINGVWTWDQEIFLKSTDKSFAKLLIILEFKKNKICLI